MIIPNIWKNKLYVPNHQPAISILLNKLYIRIQPLTFSVRSRHSPRLACTDAGALRDHVAFQPVLVSGSQNQGISKQPMGKLHRKP